MTPIPENVDDLSIDEESNRMLAKQCFRPFV